MEGLKELQAKAGSSGVLFINLGRLFNPETYSMFGQNAISVVQIADTAWEKPPGMGILPLRVIFEVCKTIQHFLSFDEDNTVVGPGKLLSFTFISSFSHACTPLFSFLNSIQQASLEADSKHVSLSGLV